MNPEELELLKKTAVLAEENHTLLQKMQKSTRFTRNFKIGYWILIIVLSVFSLWGFQTYIGSIQDAFSGAGLSNSTPSTPTTSSGGSSSDTSTSDLTNLLNELK